MRKWFWPVTALVTSLVLLSTGCSARKPSLVLSVPLPSGYSSFWGTSDNFYFMFTDSLLCITRFIPDSSDSSSGTLGLYRIPLEGSGKCDTLVFPNEPLLDVFYKADVPHGNNLNVYDWKTWQFTPPGPGYVLYPLPLGDTSGMSRFGHLDGLYCDTFTRERFEYELHSAGQRFYLIDMNSPVPRTVASFEGLVLDFYYPYLLLYTEFTYKEYGVMIHKDNMDFKGAHYIVIDVRDLRKVVDFRNPDGQGMLTPDHRFLFAEGDPLPDPKRDSIVSMTERWNVIELDIETGDTSRKVIRIPWCSFAANQTRAFLAPDGKALFLGDRESWGMEIDRSFAVPAVADFQDSIYSALWFQRLIGKGEWLDWKLSPEGRWLIVMVNNKIAHRSVYSMILPSSALTDPRVLDSLSPRHLPYRTLHRSLYNAVYDFLPGEKWAIIRNEEKDFFSMMCRGLLGIGSAPQLYRCDGKFAPFTLPAPGVMNSWDAFFSPDSRHMGYVCNTQNGLRFKVWKLPDVD